MNQNNKSMPRYCLRKHKKYNRWKNLLFDELCIKCEIRERLNDYFEILKSDKRDILSDKNKNFFGKKTIQNLEIK